MSVRIRVTVTGTDDRAGSFRIATRLQELIWGCVPVSTDPVHPVRGIHRDEQGRAYFEFVTESVGAVRRVAEEADLTGRVAVGENPPLPGEECSNCGNIAGPAQPAVCPNCGFRDISDCPNCHHPISRQAYEPVGGNLFRCPHCRTRVRLAYSNPMFLPDGHYNQPLVVVTEAAVGHEVR